MSKKKITLIVVAVAVVGFIAYIIFGGGVTTSNTSTVTEPETNSTTLTPSTKAVLDEQPSLIEEKTGERDVSDLPPYVPTGDDVMAIITPLIQFDTNTQTYDEWHEHAKSKVAFSVQDFPERMIVGITPSRERWDEGWKREYIASLPTLMGEYPGSGDVTVYDWRISGYQTLFDPSGEPYTGAQNDVMASVACGGPTVDDCYVYAYYGDWPLYFEEEVL